MMGYAGRTVLGLLLFAAATGFANAEEGGGVRWLTDPQMALRQAHTSGRPVLMKFTAEWCGYCRKMERETFSEPVTADVVHRNFVPLLIDADEHGDIVRQFKIKGLPAMLIVTPDMTVVERITGFQTTAKLLPKLNAVIASHPAPRVPALPAAQQRTTTVETAPNPFADNPFDAPLPTPENRNPRTTGPGGFDNRAAAPVLPSFNGLCLTSVIDQRELIPGSREFAAEYRGQVLHFHDAAQRQTFFQNPDRYWPMLDGNCALTLLESGQSVPGQLKFAAVFRDRIWVFQSRSVMERFIESPADFALLAAERQKLSKTADRSY